MKNAYLRFLTLVSKLDEQHSVQKVDAEARKLLDLITIHHSENNPLTVTAAMQISDIASPSTIHRKIVVLKKCDLATIERKEGNRRTKYLVPTDLALKRYESLSRALVNCNANLE